MFFDSTIRNGLGLLAFGLALAGSGFASELAVAPLLDRTGLPALGATWLERNPYRGNARALEVGQAAFNQSCARCHGGDANPAGGAPAPDLRQLNRYCGRIADPATQAACMADNDQYFKKSVLEGKVVAGVRHMPSWREVLIQEDVWAIQAFIEAQTGGVEK